jgi:hypothetical protein
MICFGFVSLSTGPCADVEGQKRASVCVLVCPWPTKISSNLVEVWVMPDLTGRPFCIWDRALGHVFTQKDAHGHFASPRWRCPYSPKSCS